MHESPAIPGTVVGSRPLRILSDAAAVVIGPFSATSRSLEFPLEALLTSDCRRAFDAWHLSTATRTGHAHSAILTCRSGVLHPCTVESGNARHLDTHTAVHLWLHAEVPIETLSSDVRISFHQSWTPERVDSITIPRTLLLQAASNALRAEAR